MEELLIQASMFCITYYLSLLQYTIQNEIELEKPRMFIRFAQLLIKLTTRGIGF